MLIDVDPSNHDRPKHYVTRFFSRIFTLDSESPLVRPNKAQCAAKSRNCTSEIFEKNHEENISGWYWEGKFCLYLRCDDCASLRAPIATSKNAWNVFHEITLFGMCIYCIVVLYFYFDSSAGIEHHRGNWAYDFRFHYFSSSSSTLWSWRRCLLSLFFRFVIMSSYDQRETLAKLKILLPNFVSLFCGKRKTWEIQQCHDEDIKSFLRRLFATQFFRLHFHNEQEENKPTKSFSVFDFRANCNINWFHFFFSFPTDLEITCDGQSWRWLGHIESLSGQAWPMPLSRPASNICRCQDFPSHQPTEWNRITQSTSCLRAVSYWVSNRRPSLNFKIFIIELAFSHILQQRR